MQYVIRRTRYSSEITKFEDRTYPSGTYTITDTRCFCPARTRSCKHMKIYRHWKRNGMKIGVVYDDSANEISNLFSWNFLKVC